MLVVVSWVLYHLSQYLYLLVLRLSSSFARDPGLYTDAQVRASHVPLPLPLVSWSLPLGQCPDIALMLVQSLFIQPVQFKLSGFQIYPHIEFKTR